MRVALVIKMLTRSYYNDKKEYGMSERERMKDKVNKKMITAKVSGAQAGIYTLLESLSCSPFTMPD